MPGTFSPPSRVSDPDMHHGTCVTYVPWCMPGSLTCGFLWSRWRGGMFPAFPAHAQLAILRNWQEAHDLHFHFSGTGANVLLPRSQWGNPVDIDQFDHGNIQPGANHVILSDIFEQRWLIAPLGRCDNNFKNIILKLIIQNCSFDTRYQIALKWMP